MKSNKLKGKIIEKGFTIEQVADATGVDKSTFYRKLNNFDKFTIGDSMKIRDVLGLTKEEACEIFLA